MVYNIFRSVLWYYISFASKSKADSNSFAEKHGNDGGYVATVNPFGVQIKRILNQKL